jgi:hypothetical protein
MFPRKSPTKNPIKLGTNTKKLNDMNAFIDNELKILQSMNRRQHPKSLINPININNTMAESQNNLKNVMAKTTFGVPGVPTKPVEDQMRTSQSKFEGFSNVTKFTDNSNTSTIIDKKDSRRTRRPPSTSSNKSEPFVIKFPTELGTKNKNKEILKHLNKEKEIDINFKNNNIMGNITGLKAENKVKEKEEKKPYIESFNKIGEKPKNIFGDEEIEEDYGDFENVDENKNENNNNENKNDWEDMFGENANFNDIDEERKLKPTMINKEKSKREQIIERMNDIRNIILLSEEYIEIASMDKNEDNNNILNLDGNMNQGKQETGINTDVINYKDKATATEENFDFNLDNDNNDEEIKEKESNKELHLGINSYNEAGKEKKSKIMIASYQPMSYDAYNVFVKIAPSIETMLLNNINKYILQKKDDKQIEETTGMHKLSSEFNFPNDLLTYMFPKNSNQIKINIDKFLFFNTKPYLIAYSLSLTSKDSTSISQVFQDNFGDINSANLIMIYDIFTKKVIKTLFSQSKVNDMVTIGEGENLLVTARIGGEFDIFDISQKNDDNNEDIGTKYFMGFETNYASNNLSLGREEINNNKNTSMNNSPKFKLILPIFSSYNFLQNINNNQEENGYITFNSQVKKMIKVINKNTENNNYIDKLYELFIFDQTGYLLSFQFTDSDIRSMTRLEHIFNEPYINFDLNPLIKRCFNTMPDNGDYIKENLLTEIYDIKYYKENTLFILCNFGLCKLTIEGKDTFLCNIIYSCLSEENPNTMTCFDISDLGQIVCCFNDKTVKVINEENKELLISSVIDGISDSTLINNVMWSKVICKNENNKLIRRHLLANFFIFTSKNEFIIYDLNQKKTENLRKIKKLKEFGKGLKLSRKNSVIDMSDCSFTDYSNYILMSECDQLNKAKFSITKLSLRKQYYDEGNIIKVNNRIISKLKNLINN